jgi:hypothetical protein
LKTASLRGEQSGALFGLVVVGTLTAGLVQLVRRMIERHQPSEEELRAAEQQGAWTGAHLPTLTTEMTGKVARDPQFEIDAQTVRGRQGF